MKTELKAKFLQHLLGKKKETEGFTLIALLVVIIIIGILSAIALPSFLNQASKAKQTEAKTFVGAVNRAQQTYRMENTTFASDIVSLQVNLPTSTDSYNYVFVNTSSTATTFNATPVSSETSTLRAYSGSVVVIASSGQTAAAACMTTAPSSNAPTATITATSVNCGGTQFNMK
ncbi:MAG: type IV pilin-like G/H family protein [Dolichospermum sp.]